MGTADVVPGVSGGTMALVLGIYQPLVKALGHLDRTFVTHLWKGELRDALSHANFMLLSAVGLGMVSAVVFFTRWVSLPKLITLHPEPVYGLFFGLILGSAVLLYRGLGGLSGWEWVSLCLGVMAGLAVVNLSPAETPNDSWFIFLAGVIAISAMMLPGVSGSFVLLMMKKYAYVFGAIGRFDLAVIGAFGLGVAMGLIGFARLLAWVLQHYYRLTVASMVGLLVGSLMVVWPFQERMFEVVREKPRLVGTSPVWPSDMSSAAVPFMLVAVGLFAVWLLHRSSLDRDGAQEAGGIGGNRE